MSLVAQTAEQALAAATELRSKAQQYLLDHPEACFECNTDDFGPAQFVGARSHLSNDLAVPVTHCLFGRSIWPLLMGHEGFIQVIDPVTKMEDVEKGHVANIFGMALWTDAYAHPEKHFLDANEMIFVSADETKFAYLKLVSVPVRHLRRLSVEAMRLGRDQMRAALGMETAA